MKFYTSTYSARCGYRDVVPAESKSLLERLLGIDVPLRKQKDTIRSILALQPGQSAEFVIRSHPRHGDTMATVFCFATEAEGEKFYKG